MKELLLIAIGPALVNNVVPDQFLGLCPFLGVSREVEASAGMGTAVIFVIAATPAATSLVHTGILVDLHLECLQTIVFILVITALVRLVEMFLKKSMPSPYEALGAHLPLIIIDYAVLGVAPTDVTKSYNFVQSVVNGIDISVGFIIVIVMLTGVCEKIEHNDIPCSFRGSPIVLITSDLTVITFFGFSGLI